MNSKPVNPKLHGIIDYAFAAILIGLPAVLSINKKAKRAYVGQGLAFLTTNAFTNTPVGLMKSMSFKAHQKADAAFLMEHSMLTLSNPVRQDKKALIFHCGFLAMAVAHYLLTDYNAKS